MRVSRFIIRAIMVSIVAVAIYGFLRIPSVARLLSSRKSINVVAWPNVIDSRYFKEFEKETGIKVYLTFFENFEELIVKMRAGSGDYDLIMASDYAVNQLKDEQIIKPIEKEKLRFFDQIYPALLGLYFDPENRYSVPFSWELYGIGINLDAFNGVEPPATWGLLFDKKLYDGPIGMLDDAREAVSIAATYLFNNKKELDDKDLLKIKQLLFEQKSRVAMYTDLRADYVLLSQTAPVVVSNSADIFHAMSKYDKIKFLQAQEGSFVIVDNWFIPASSKKNKYVYDFLNYLYQPDVMKQIVDRYAFFPVRRGIITDKDRFFIKPTQELFAQARFFNYKIPEQALRNLWIALKS